MVGVARSDKGQQQKRASSYQRQLFEIKMN